MPILESCHLNDSTKDGRLTMAHALSSSRLSVLGRVFKSVAITIELNEINSCNFIYIRVSYQVNMWDKMYWFMSLPLVKVNPKRHNSLTLCYILTKL